METVASSSPPVITAEQIGTGHDCDCDHCDYETRWGYTAPGERRLPRIRSYTDKKRAYSKVTTREHRESLKRTLFARADRFRRAGGETRPTFVYGATKKRNGETPRETGRGHGRGVIF